VIELPYVRYLVSPPREKPARFIHRPVIPVKLRLGRGAITFEGLVDSGADECTFPAWIAKMLGRNVHKGRPRIFSGIGGSALAYRHRTELEVDGVRFAADVYYSHDWDDMPFGLLGQAGFFPVFDVEFCYRDKTLRLKQR
jgi:hypothetical protein